MSQKPPPDSPAVTAIKADAAEGARRVAALKIQIEACAIAAPVETACGLILTRLAAPGLAEAALAQALGHTPDALTPAGVAELLGAPVAAIQIWAAAIAATATGQPAAAEFDAGGGQLIRMKFNPPPAGSLQ